MNNKKILRTAWREASFKMGTSVTSRALIMLIPIIFGLMVDNITNQDYNNAYILGFILIGMYVVYRIADVLNTYSWHKFYNKLYNIYTDMALNKTFNNSMFSLSRISLSEYINIMNNDINVICTFWCDLTIRICRVVEFVIIFVYFFMINTFIGIAGIIVSLIAFTLIFLSSKKIENLNQKRAANLDSKTSALHELLLCIKEIKTLNIFKPIKSRVIKKTDKYSESWLKQRVVEDIFKFSTVLLIEIFRIGLFIYGIYLISKGDMQLGVLMVIYNYYAQLVDNFSEFAVVNTGFRNLKVSFIRYNKIFEYSRDIRNDNKIINEHPKGEIVFKDILYGYKDDPTLSDLSFKTKENSITAITGPSGSGRSGIFHLLLRLNRQHEGTVTIDGFNINDYNVDEYFYLVSSVFKEPIFFNMSIKSNLCIVEEDMTKIVDICKKLEIHDYIINLKDGYETVINNEANNINSEVKYLLGIARVLLREPKIMLFDETFSTFSKKAKEKIIEILLELKENHTIMIITKDNEVLKVADKILLINNNKLIATGTHETLYKRNKLYKENII